MDNEKIGRLIAICRKEKNLTQEELANILHVSNKTVSKWETGRGCPSIDIILPLSKILNVKLEDFMEVKNNFSYEELLIENVSNRKKVRTLKLICGIILCLFLCFLEVILYYAKVSSKIATIIFGSFLLVLMIMDIFSYFIYRK